LSLSGNMQKYFLYMNRYFPPITGNMNRLWKYVLILLGVNNIIII